MDIGSIRTALAESLSDLDVRVSEFVPQAILPPCVVIYPEDIPDYGTDFTNGFTLTFTIWCFVAALQFQGAQDTLDGWLSNETDGSITAAVERDNTLGGVVSSCLVTSITDYGFTTLEGQGDLLQAKIHVEVLT